MTDLTLVRDLFLILLIGFIGGFFAKKMNLPLVVGYLLSGIIASSVPVSFLASTNIKSIAEIGVALLCFTLGLEYTLSKIKVLGETVITASFIQLVLTTLFGIAIFPFFGMNFYESMVLGVVFSLSSTAVVVKVLSEKGELESLYGEITAGWLFMQDLYTIPIIIILPTLGRLLSQEFFGIYQFLEIGKSLLFSFIIFFLVFYAGKKVIPQLAERIANLKSRELVLLAAVTLCLSFSLLLKFFGFSFALGAFIAGVLISSSSAHHGIFAEVRPLKDLFSVVFFVTLGLMLNFSLIFNNLAVIVSFALIIIFLKFLISFLLIFFLGYHGKTSFLVATSLINVGEFAFILASMVFSQYLISENLYLLILTVSFVTLVISVPLMTIAPKVYYLIKNFFYKKFPQLTSNLNKLRGTKELENGKILENHVVVLGFGRVGKYICRALTMTDIPYVVVDYNHQLVKKLKSEGINIIYGDPAEIDVLQFAQVRNAKALILAYNDHHMQEIVVSNAHSLNPNLKLLCRTHADEDIKKLKGLGVEIIVQPEFEAAISIVEKLLQVFNINNEEISGKISRLKIEHGLQVK